MSQTYLQPVADARFEAGTETTDTSAVSSPTPPSGDGGNGDRTKRSASKARADQPLPTDRLKFDKQVKILRAVAATSGNARRGSTAEAMSAAIDLSGGTGGLNSRFFRSANWFEAVGRGEYTASAGVIAYNQHITIDPDAHYEATAQMRDEVRDSWFWGTLQPMLVSGHPISLKLAVLELARASGATDHAAQLETIIDWLVWVGLLENSDGQIKLRGDADETAAAVDQADDAVADQVEEMTADSVPDETPLVVETQPSSPPASSASASSDLDAIVSFNMSVRLTAADMKSLDQEQRDFVLALAERLRG